MRAAFSTFFLFFSAFAAFGQIFNPVTWSSSAKHLGGDEFELIFVATIQPGWVVYSQYLESDEGPVPTTFTYTNKADLELLGKNKESGEIKEVFDPLFEMKVKKISKKGTFIQKIRALNYTKPLSGFITFMTCDDERCLPPEEVPFEIVLEKPSSATPAEDANKPKTTQEVAEDTMPKVDLFSNNENFLKSGNNADFQPVRWSIEGKSLGSGMYQLVFSADIIDGWVTYSQFQESEDGPVPTSFDFDPADHYSLQGKCEESGNIKSAFDEVFKMNLKKIAGKGIFTQKLAVSDPAKPVTGVINFMTCDDKQCIFSPGVPFRAYFAENRFVTGDGIQDNTATAPDQEGLAALYCNFPPLNLDAPLSGCGDQTLSGVNKSNVWNIFLLGFLGGLLALLTPCVFPMVPITVGFFTKSSQNKSKGLSNALLYGGSIFMVYIILSLPFHLMDNISSDILNQVSTNVWLNLLFFVVFLFFAFSFFGFYELTLPSNWVNKASSAEGVGGVIGIFFMALTLALVSFSCTGPILGALLAGALSTNGGAWQLTSGMAGFGLALALPFALFAAFPSWLNALPKRGGWMNTVKVILGFIELALALKFLSNADLVKHWGVLKIEGFLGLWILISAGLALYLFGILRFPHDSPLKRITATRWVLGIGALTFMGYLFTGFFYDSNAGSYKPLKLLSGLAPPVCYSWFQPCDCPQNLNCFKDFCEGLQYARENNKPIMIDFTGHACVNCRKMEEHVWPNPSVYPILKNDYVLISLYVDEKINLPEEQQIVVNRLNGAKRKLQTYGHKWSHFQELFFQTNSQPFYVLLSPEGKLLTNPVGYTPEDQDFADFLRCGKETFERQNALSLQ